MQLANHVLLALTLASPAAAQGFGPQVVISTAADDASSVRAIDLDADGDADVLSASSADDTIAWYENLGSGSFGPQQIISTAADFATVVDAADLDGDGDADVLSASLSDTKLAWYENLGGGAFGPERVITNALGSAWISIGAADLDGDGDVDVVSASAGFNGGDVAWYENLGGGAFGPQQSIAASARQARALRASDLAGDGDTDVLTAEWGGPFGASSEVAWYENSGVGAFGPRRVVASVADAVQSVDVADLDADGDLDVLSASEGGQLGVGEVAWIENLGAGTFGVRQVVASGVRANVVRARDLNGDGDADLLFASGSSGLGDEVAWHQNLGGGNFGAGQLISTAVIWPRSIEAADLDGDGDADVLSASADDKIAWYENLSSAPPPTCAGLTALGVAFANDVSADGDVVVGEQFTTFGGPLAFRWTAGGGLQDLGTLLGAGSRAFAVSADGVIVVGGDYGFQQWSAFRWTAAGGMQHLPIPGVSTATDVSANGAVVVGYGGASPTANQYAFRWTAAGGAQNLGTLGGPEAWATGVNHDGSVVVGTSRIASGALRAFRWTAAGGMQDLGALGADSEAAAVSADGAVVVGSSSGRAFRWTAAGGMQDLGILPGDTTSLATDVNADGSVVVGRSENQRPAAFRWTASEGMRPLSSSLTGPSAARAVSSDGTVVVGDTQGPGGPGQAFRVQSSVLGETYCRPTAANSAGCGALILAQGDPRLATGALELTATLLPVNTTGYFLTSRAQDLVHNPGGSQGNLCLGGDVGRFVGPGQVMNTGAAGAFTLAVDLSALPTPTGPVVAQPGETWSFQCWHRDTNPMPTSNFTDAVSIQFR